MINPVVIMYGTDPELFVKGPDGNIVGSEKVIPEDGLVNQYHYTPVVVRDGVQIELNPPCGTINDLGTNLKDSFRLLAMTIKLSKYTLCYDGMVEVSREELDSLSLKSRSLGCLPSLNCYEDRPIKADPKTYRKRSAGGHLHFGIKDYLPNLHTKLVDERSNIIPYFDIFVGTICVLLDRDPNAAERRENYGRAGEFRCPKHGVEYRTPSNFWLKDYALMNLLFGMGNFAISVINDSRSGHPAIEDELSQAVNLDAVIQAINTNDYDLAKGNFKAIVPFLAKYLPKGGFPLNPGNLDRFLTFTDFVKDKGLETFFPGTPDHRWLNIEKVPFDQFLSTLY